MVRICLILIFYSCAFHGFTNRLIKYYDGELDLTRSQVLSICDSLISSETTSYLLALACYQKAVLISNSLPFEEYDLYEIALSHLDNADTSDSYLYSAILENQGYILKSFGLGQFAIEKYKKALPYSREYSLERKLRNHYNLAWALERHNREHALRLFLEVIEEAKAEKLHDRVAKSYLEISKMFNHSFEYQGALNHMDSAMRYAENPYILGLIYHNLAHTYYLIGDYSAQRIWLKKALGNLERSTRFTSLMDLGESLILSGNTEKAYAPLREALVHYDHQELHPDNFKVFEWMYQLYPDSAHYVEKQVGEFKKFVEVKEQLEALLKQQAMLQLYLRLEEKKEARKTIGLWQSIALIIGSSALVIYLAWRIWWYRLRMRLSAKIIALGEKVGKSKYRTQK